MMQLVGRRVHLGRHAICARLHVSCSWVLLTLNVAATVLQSRCCVCLSSHHCR